MKPRQIEVFRLEETFNKFLEVLKDLFRHSSLECVQDILNYIEPEASLYKTFYNKYLQSVFSFIDLQDKNKEHLIREIFKEYFKNNSIGNNEIRNWFHIYHLYNPNARVILYEEDEHN